MKEQITPNCDCGHSQFKHGGGESRMLCETKGCDCDGVTVTFARIAPSGNVHHMLGGDRNNCFITNHDAEDVLRCPICQNAGVKADDWPETLDDERQA